MNRIGKETIGGKYGLIFRVCSRNSDCPCHFWSQFSYDVLGIKTVIQALQKELKIFHDRIFNRGENMLLKIFFLLAALSIPVSIVFHQEAIGILTALAFMFIGAYFSKPRFKDNPKL